MFLIFKPGMLPDFLKLFQCGCLCVCPLLMLLITSAMILTTYDWLNKSYSFYIATVVIVSGEYSLRIKAHFRNQPNKSKLPLYMLLLFNTLFTIPLGTCGEGSVGMLKQGVTIFTIFTIT